MATQGPEAGRFNLSAQEYREWLDRYKQLGIIQDYRIYEGDGETYYDIAGLDDTSLTQEQLYFFLQGLNYGQDVSRKMAG